MIAARWHAAWLLALFLLAGPSVAHAQELPDPSAPTQQLKVFTQTNLHQLSWRDAEDVLEGAILPVQPQVGEPMTVSVRVGAVQGARFDGPVSLTIRALEAPAEQTKIVQRDGERWVTEFIPKEPGPHQLTVSFRTTRHKVLHGGFTVHPASVPRAWAWALAGLVMVVAVALGAVRLLRKKPEENPVAPEEKGSSQTG